jgi:cytochrome c551/c552
MKNVFLFFLISFGGAIIIWKVIKEDTSRTASSEKILIQSHSSEDILEFMRNSFWASQKDSVPKVELVLLGEKNPYSWDSQIRYAIKVSDENDGDSRYGEINGNAVLLEIEYLPMADEEIFKTRKKVSEKEHEGLTLMKSSSCFACHADKTQLTGPSFSKITKKYEKTSANIKSLAGKITKGSSGVWGSSIMPANPDFTEKEAEGIADYILTQGGKKNNWILPGLEGVFQIIKKPNNSAKGVYILTASYKSKSGVIGWDSVILDIE